MLLNVVQRSELLNDFTPTVNQALKAKLFQTDRGLDQEFNTINVNRGNFQAPRDGSEYDLSALAAKLERNGLVWANKPEPAAEGSQDSTAESTGSVADEIESTGTTDEPAGDDETTKQ